MDRAEDKFSAAWSRGSATSARIAGARPAAAGSGKASRRGAHRLPHRAPGPLGRAPRRLSLPEVLLRRSEGRCRLVLTGFRIPGGGRAVAPVERTFLRIHRAWRADPASGGRTAGEARPHEWRAGVRAATQAIRAERSDKVVLARKRVITLRAPIDVDALARRMAQACEGGAC